MSYLLFQLCSGVSSQDYDIHNLNTGLMYAQKLFAMLSAIALWLANEDNHKNSDFLRSNLVGSNSVRSDFIKRVALKKNSNDDVIMYLIGQNSQKANNANLLISYGLSHTISYMCCSIRARLLKQS